MGDQTLVGLANWRHGLRWFAAEFLVVVSGILVALAVQSWWSDRADRLQEQALLQRLRAEFVSNRKQYDEIVQEHNEIIEHVKRVLEWTGPKPPAVDVETFEANVSTLLNDLPAFRPATSELDAMLSTGQLALLRNAELRAKLSEWPVALEALRRTEDNLTQMVVGEFYPYLLERTPLLNWDLRDGFFVGPPNSRFERNYDALLRDVSFENHVETRWTMAVFILGFMEPTR